MQDKELLFKEFADSNSCDTVIHDDLLGYVLDLSMKQSEIESQEESSLAGHAKEARPDVESHDEGISLSFPPQLITLFNKFDTKVTEGKPTELDISDRTRLFLQASAWFAERRSWQVLGNHEINYIYTYRKEWELSDSEKWFLFRSFIEESNNRPGWCWFEEWEEYQTDDLVTWIASHDSNNDVCSAALSLLADVGFKADRELLQEGLKETNKQILVETIRLLRNTENVDNLDLISTIINNEDVDIREKAISAKIEIMYLNNPNDGFRLLIESGARIPPLINKTIEDMSLSVDDKLLFEALDRAETSVRRFSAQYMRKSKLLTKGKCDELLRDTDAGVRKEGLLELIEIGED